MKKTRLQKSHATVPLKALSSEMEEGIKVVSIERSLLRESPPRHKFFFMKGTVHNLHLKISALYQVSHFKGHGTVYPKLRCFYSYRNSKLGELLQCFPFFA